MRVAAHGARTVRLRISGKQGSRRATDVEVWSPGKPILRRIVASEC